MRRSRDSEGPGARRVVPAYALTGGRTRSVGHDLPIETMVSATVEGMRLVVDLRFEQRDIVLLCRRTQSVAEVAARLRVPLGVARVLVSDLTADGHLAVNAPTGDRPDRAVLERLLVGLRAR
jgi:hypothetical protein